jgi:hypothetical protein
MGLDGVRYHFLCPAHGPVGSVPISRRVAPHTSRCPVCRNQLEVWIGAQAPRSAAADNNVVALRPAG